jgi:hypothetical protein
MGISDSVGINSIAIRSISCCFVIVTRGDLREEFSMADDAFALSPISARASLPSEEDYAAIAEAFMETSRGRWFLTEYAKRNRNADTRMVLDAVARIEQGLAAQKEESLQKEANLHREDNLLQESLAAHQQQAADAEAAATAARNNLNDALAVMRGAVEAAQQSAAEALDNLALEARLAPVRKGARVLREIAWRLREIGNDGRICDLIDSQVAVIEAGAEPPTMQRPRSWRHLPRSKDGCRNSAAMAMRPRELRIPRRQRPRPLRRKCLLLSLPRRSPRRPSRRKRPKHSPLHPQKTCLRQPQKWLRRPNTPVQQRKPGKRKPGTRSSKRQKSRTQ